MKHRFRFAIWTFAVALASLIPLPAIAANVAPADVVPSIAERFAADPVPEVVDFQKHVVPLLGKLGCNGRACHGSFQGQGDFRLSLFGYDFQMDHEGLLDRLDVESPDESYALLKAIGLEDHGGGERTSRDDWEYRVLRQWVADGAPSVDTIEDPENAKKHIPDPAILVSLRIEPASLEFEQSDESVALRVFAEWGDGVVEDVTPLARYSTNDDQIATVSEDGVVTSRQAGGTHIVVTYDNGVQPVPVIRSMPGTISEGAFAEYDETPVDRAVADRLRVLNIEPSQRADDATFLRRVSLDIAGTLPTAEEVRLFLADTSADKRERKIDELLDSPAYVDLWTVWLADMTGNSERFQNNLPGGAAVSAKMWQSWLRKRLADNVPYDEIVEGIVLAQSRLPGESYADYCARSSQMLADQSMEDAPGLVQYWARANFRKPEDRAIGFAYTFLGLRIECAQCHKHPFDEWTQADFADFQNFFVDPRYGRHPEAKKEADAMLAKFELGELRGNQLRRELAKLARDGEVVPTEELFSPQALRAEADREKAKKRNRKYRPRSRNARVLGGDEVTLASYSDPREPLMQWLVGDARDLFARAAVNRIWAKYFGRGIVHPTDDLSLANPPSNKALLDYLTAGFIESDYDLKWVHRTIANSRTYQTSWQPTESNRLDEKHFARSLIRRLPAEVAVDAVASATAADATAESFLASTDGRSIAVAGVGSRGNRGGNYALTIFGKNLREANCDCERSDEPSLLQTVYLRNDLEVLSQLDRGRDGWLAQVARELDQPLNSKIANDRTKYRPADYARRIAAFDKSIERLKSVGRTDAVKKANRAKAAYLKRYRKLPAKPGSERVDGEQSSVALADVDRIVEAAYLRTLSRYPTAAERENGIAAILETDEAMSGVRDLLWALVNTKEFQVNH